MKTSPLFKATLYRLSTFLLLTIFLHSAQAATVVDLGTLLPGGYSQAFAINNNGVVVGLSDDHAFVWTAGDGILALPDYGVSSSALGVNDNNEVVGYSKKSVPGNPGASNIFYVHAVSWKKQGGNWHITDLGQLPVGSTKYYSSANAINGTGKIVGVGNVASGAYHAFKKGNGPPTDLLTLPGGSYSAAFGINDSGFVVGFADSPTQNGQGRAFVLDPNAGNTLPSAGVDLGKLYFNDFNSMASAINNSPQPYVVGHSGTRAFCHRFTGFGSSLVSGPAPFGDDLGMLPGDYVSEAAAINVGRDVVGTSSGTFPRAFVYYDPTNPLNGMTDLTAQVLGSGWILTSAYGINDAGWIVGQGITSGQTHAFLFQP